MKSKKRPAAADKEASLKRQNEYLAALHDTTLGLMNRLDQKELLESIVKHAAKLFKTPHGFLYLVEPDGEIEVKIGLGVFMKYVGFRMRSGEGMAGKVLQTGEPLTIVDYDTWPGRSQKIGYNIFHALAGVPLKSGRKTVGVLGIALVEKGRLFFREDMSMLIRFAHLASIAFDNARLYSRAVTELEERRKAEIMLRKSQSLLTESQAIAHIGSWEWETGPNRVTWSEELYRIYGLDEKSFDPTFEGFLERVHPADREITRKAIELSVKTSKPFDFYERIVRPDGSVRTLRSIGRVVVDRDGKMLKLTGICQDVTDMRAMETERERMKKKLEEYAERLELKVRKLEKKGIALNDNEKRVFSFLVSRAGMSDAGLSEMTGIKRPTVTAIRNRLVGHGWLAPAVIPNFSLMGCELAGISYGKAARSDVAKKFRVMDMASREPEVVFMNSTNSQFISVSFFKSLAEARIRGPIGSDAASPRPYSTLYFPLSACRIERFMDFSKCAKRLFGTDAVQSPERPAAEGKQELSAKEKGLLTAFIEHPGTASSEIAHLLGISPPTVTKARERFLKEGWFMECMLPDLKKLDQPLSMVHARFSAGLQKEELERGRKRILDYISGFIQIWMDSELIIIGLFIGYPELEYEFSEAMHSLQRKGILAEYPNIVAFQQKNIRFRKMDFVSLSRKTLGNGRPG